MAKKTPYTQCEKLYGMLLAQIISGVRVKGELLPTLNEICAQYKVKIGIVLRALERLEQEGYIRTKRGKQAVVVFENSEAALLQYLTRKKEALKDVFQIWRILLPNLAVHGARLCEKNDLDYLRDLLRSYDGETITVDEYTILIQKFIDRLVSMFENPILSDLRHQLTLFSKIPYTRSPQDTRADCMDWYRVLEDSLFCIEHHEESRLIVNFEKLYLSYETRMLEYLAMLPEPNVALSPVEFSWQPENSTPPLYIDIALQLIMQMSMGNISDGERLPSIIELAEKFDASEITIRGAIRLLNQLGLIEAKRGRGCTVTLSEARQRQPALASETAKQGLKIFLYTMQAIFLLCPKLAEFSMDFILDDDIEKIGAWIENGSDADIFVQGGSPFLQLFLDRMPSKTLRDIVKHLCDLERWGYFLVFCEYKEYRVGFFAQQIRLVYQALRERDMVKFGERLQEVYSLNFEAVKANLLLSGIQEVLPIICLRPLR
ncbi:GntR family transcriptional regulator [Anaerotruncus rubiinfantis]|uniref:GntR family transcriptional regulator n=1 Tax=Anaerotruncus rubiinfantis TaxID=1720200 RepID=UPI0034A3463D